MMNRKAVEAALYSVIESEDSDLAEMLEGLEDGSPSKYPALADLFVSRYEEIMAGPRPGVACICGHPHTRHAAHNGVCLVRGCNKCWHFTKKEA